MNKDTFYPEFDNEDEDRDRTLKDDLGETIDEEKLNYNVADDSFEYDVKSDNGDYQHPDPYNTSVKNGEDMNSTYDEANPYDTAGEYIPNQPLGNEGGELGGTTG